MSSDRDDLIVLIDENGNEVEAEYIDTIEYRGNEYVVLLPRDENESDDEEDNGEEEVVILKVEQGENEDEESFVAIDDESEQDAVFEIFTQRMEEMEFDDEDLDEDDDDGENNKN